MTTPDFELERDKRWQMHVHVRRVCQTSGCFTYVLDKRDRYCLACQLDKGLGQRAEPRPGRPRQNTLTP